MNEEMRTDIEDWDEEPADEHDSDASIGSGPPRDNKWGTKKGDDYTPVEGYQTHTQAVSDTKNLVDLDIVGGDPADP
jgi:hypothetical protein